MKAGHQREGAVLAGKLCTRSATAEEFLDVGQFEANRSTNPVVRNLPLFLPRPERSRGDRKQSANLTRLQESSLSQFVFNRLHSVSMREDSTQKVLESATDSLVFSPNGDSVTAPPSLETSLRVIRSA